MLRTSKYIAMIVAVPVLLTVLAQPVVGQSIPNKPLYKNWGRSYELSRYRDWILSVAPTSDGGYIGAGFVKERAEGEDPPPPGENEVAALVKVDADGNLQWYHTYEDGTDECNIGRLADVIEVEDGYVAVGEERVPLGINVGTGEPTGCVSKPFFVKTNRDGEALVMRRLTEFFGRGQGVRATSDEIVVAGHASINPNSQSDFLFVKLNKHGDETLLVRRYDSGSSDDRAVDLEVIEDPSGSDLLGFVLVGRGMEDFFIVAVDTNATERWRFFIDSRTLTYRLNGRSEPFSYEQTVTDVGPCTPAAGHETHVDGASSIVRDDHGDLIIGGHFNRFAINPGVTPRCGNLPFYRDEDGVLVKIKLRKLDFDGLAFVTNVAHCSGLDYHTIARIRPPVAGTQRNAFSCTTADEGVVTPGDTANMLLVEVDGSGNPLSHHVFKADGAGACAFDMDVARDGGFIVGGNNTSNGDDWVLVKLYDSCQRDEFFHIEGGLEVAGDTVWDTYTKVRGTIRVVDDGKLTITGGTTIEFADTRQLNDFDDLQTRNDFSDNTKRTGIVVEPGGELVVADATLRGIEACNGMFEGLQVIGDPGKPQFTSVQGTLRATRATIEDAIIAVEVGKTRYDANGHLVEEFGYGGGIALLTDSTLRNNLKGISFQPYISPRHPTFNRGRLIGTLFECSNELRDPDFVDEKGRRLGVVEHVSLFGVQVVNVQGSTFQAIDSCRDLDFDLRGTGITAFDARFLVNRRCVSPTTLPVTVCEPGGENLFRGLTEGIRSEASRPGRFFQVRDSAFDDVWRGISSTNQSFDSIANSQFRIPSPPEISLPATDAAYGVRMEGASGFSLVDSELTADLPFDNHAVIVEDSGDILSTIADNELRSTASGISAIGSNPELQIFCNIFEGHEGAWVVVRKSAPDRFANQGEACTQSGQGADNTFVGPALIYSDLQFSYYQHPTSGTIANAAAPWDAASFPACTTPPLCPRPSCQGPACLLFRPGTSDVTASANEISHVLEELDTVGARRHLVELLLERGELSRVEALLADLPGESAEDQNFHLLSGLLLALYRRGGALEDLFVDELATMKWLAGRETRSGARAASLLKRHARMSGELR